MSDEARRLIESALADLLRAKTLMWSRLMVSRGADFDALRAQIRVVAAAELPLEAMLYEVEDEAMTTMGGKDGCPITS